MQSTEKSNVQIVSDYLMYLKHRSGLEIKPLYLSSRVLVINPIDNKIMDKIKAYTDIMICGGFAVCEVEQVN